jgi:hypothetical protein
MTEQRPLADVLHDILRNVQELIRAEVRLAKAEVRQDAREAATASAWVLAGAIAALTAWSFLLWAAAFGLGLVMPTWAAALVVALVTGVAAAALLAFGVRRFARWRPAPERTVASLKENVEWIRQSTS